MHNPLVVFVLAGLLLSLPALLVEASPGRERLRGALARYRRCLTWTGLLIALLATLVYVLAMQPFVDSVDFHYYICYARDMVHYPAEVPLDGYRYFPGVYAFWRTVIRLCGESPTQWQGAYLAILVANAALVAGIVLRASGRADAALLGGIWYLVLCSRFEGFAAITEPIATIPLLAGLLGWGGRPLQGRTGHSHSAFFGICLGLSLYVKQQAGLLSLGALSLLAQRGLAPTAKRHDLGPLLMLPFSAAVVFLVAILLEGRGLAPLLVGLQQVSSYEPESSWARNLYALIRNDESAALAAILVSGVWLGILVMRRTRPLIGTPWLELVGFLVVSGGATLIQFKWRAYYHYAMLALPGLVIAAIVSGVQLFRLLPPRLAANEVLRFLLLGCAIFPLAYTGGSQTTLRVWRLSLESDFQPVELWHRQPEVAHDLSQVGEWVKRGDQMIVLPPRRNAVHMVLGTRLHESPYGYYWDPQPELLAGTVTSRRVPWVLEITRRDAAGDEQNWREFRADDVVRQLPPLGYRVVMRGQTMTLWKLVR